MTYIILGLLIVAIAAVQTLILTSFQQHQHLKRRLKAFELESDLQKLSIKLNQPLQPKHNKARL